MTENANGVKFETSNFSHCSICKTWMRQIFYKKWTLARIFLVSFEHRFYEMCFNTIRRHCYKVLNPEWAVATVTTGIHQQIP